MRPAPVEIPRPPLLGAGGAELRNVAIPAQAIHAEPSGESGYEGPAYIFANPTTSNIGTTDGENVGDGDDTEKPPLEVGYNPGGVLVPARHRKSRKVA